MPADWFICALPPTSTLQVLGPKLLTANPRLAGIGRLLTECMSGIQFYLTRPAPIVRGFVEYLDSPWALVSISQAQFWQGSGFASCYGDGAVQDCLSVNIANWNTAGILWGKPAIDCTPTEIAQEVWAQMEVSLEGLGRSVLSDGTLHSWFLDPAIHPAAGGIVTSEPVVINTPGSWADRPDAVTTIPNFFLAADYVRTSIDLATMEGANEAARRAVNGLLDAAGSDQRRCDLFEPHRPLEFRLWRSLDRKRFHRGLPNILDRRSNVAQPDDLSLVTVPRPGCRQPTR